MLEPTETAPHELTPLAEDYSVYVARGGQPPYRTFADGWQFGFERGRADERASMRPIHGLAECVMCDNARVAEIEHEPYRPQDESALRAAVQDLLAKDYGAYMSVGPEAKPEDEWDEYDYLVIPAWRALKAALDGAPYEPSDAEVGSMGEGIENG